MFKKQKTISWILLLAILIGLLPMQVLAEDNNSKLIVDGCTFEFSKTSDWGSGFNGQIKITNKSQKAIENWAISFEFEYDISSFWNAELIERDENTYIIKNCGWNADIKPGCTIDIGFSGNPGNVTKIPENYILLNEKITCIRNEYVVDFNVSSDWKQAFNGEIIITNISEQTIEDWSLEFDFDKNISSFWTADIVSHEGNHYSIVNKGYNANIAPGASVSLGFRGEPGGVDNSPNNYILQKYHIADANQKAAAIHRKMAEEELANWVVPTLLELEGEFRSLYQTAQRFYREGLSFEREEQYKLAKDKYQLSWQTLYNKRKELNDINDIISYIMANPDDDHDGDGLLNGFETEAFYGCINPMKADSDDNGINDGDEDYDLDGLSNLDEQKYGTSPIDSDTDNDGINDKREIELGLNPLDPNDNQTKKEQLIISNETGIEIKINAMGNAEDKVRVAESQTVVESVYAVSPFYDISTEIDFESAEIKIPIDLSSIPEEDYDKLWIVYFDEELGGFIPIENSELEKKRLATVK